MKPYYSEQHCCSAAVVRNANQEAILCYAYYAYAVVRCATHTTHAVLRILRTHTLCYAYYAYCSYYAYAVVRICVALLFRCCSKKRVP